MGHRDGSSTPRQPVPVQVQLGERGRYRTEGIERTEPVVAVSGWRSPERTAPPGVGSASRTSTSHPRSARVIAATSPLGPAPTTIASAFSVIRSPEPRCGRSVARMGGALREQCQPPDALPVARHRRQFDDALRKPRHGRGGEMLAISMTLPTPSGRTWISIRPGRRPSRGPEGSSTSPDPPREPRCGRR